MELDPYYTEKSKRSINALSILFKYTLYAVIISLIYYLLEQCF